MYNNIIEIQDKIGCCLVVKFMQLETGIHHTVSAVVYLHIKVILVNYH